MYQKKQLDKMSWIFIASLKQFRIHDFIRDYGFVEYLQKNKVQVGDHVPQFIEI